MPAEYGPLRTVGGLLVALAGLGGLGALIFAQRRDDLTLSQTAQAVFEYQSNRAELDEWNTQIRLPDAAFQNPVTSSSVRRTTVARSTHDDGRVCRRRHLFVLRGAAPPSVSDR